MQSMSNDNSGIWQDVTGTHKELDLSDWAFMENRWGEFGEPGFTQMTLPMTAPHMTGVEGAVDSHWTFYRGDDGALLGVHARHIVDGVFKPIFIMVHPDHQRQGIGTKIADYITSKHLEETGTQFPYNEVWGALPADFITVPTANFVNKYARKAYEQ
jgi:GNAT superfamily N-acetyltransferase